MGAPIEQMQHICKGKANVQNRICEIQRPKSVAQWHINEAGRSNVRTFGDNRDIGDPVRDPAIACQPEPAHDEIIQQHVNVDVPTALFC